LHGWWIKIPDCRILLDRRNNNVSSNETTAGAPASGSPAEPFQTWMCLICGWVYDEAAGMPDEGIAPGTRWADVPMNWTCPECGARKDDFEMTVI
jgi:rubredoxin